MGHPRTIKKAAAARQPRVWADPVTPAQFKQMVRKLRRLADLPRGVRIRWILSDEIAEHGWDGLCDDHDSTTRFTVHIASHLTYEVAFATLLHELAHVRQVIYWPREVEDHGTGFWLEHGFIYRRVVGEA